MRQREDAGWTQVEAAVPAAPAIVTPTAETLLALQRGAGNAAVTRMLAREIKGYNGETSGTFEDTKLGKAEVIALIEPATLGLSEGDKKCVQLKKVGTEEIWIYVWPGLVSDSEYYEKLGKNPPKQLEQLKKKCTTYRQAKRKRETSGESETSEPKAEPKPERSADDYQRENKENERARNLELAAGKWGPETSRIERYINSAPVAMQIMDKMIEGLEWLVVSVTLPSPYDKIGDRVGDTYLKIAQGLVDGRAEVTTDMQKKLNEVAKPLRTFTNPDAHQRPTEDTQGTLLDRVSEALAELDYIAVVLTTKHLAEPVVHGAEGPRRANNQEKALAEPEDKHGDLPPLNVQNLQLDAYYRTAEGILHGDEVKNTPRALWDKLKSAAQLARQIDWLKLPVRERDGETPIVKRVGYFVQAKGPNFERLLESDSVVARLHALNELQPDFKFLQIGDSTFTYAEFKAIYTDALAWMRANGKDFPTIRTGNLPADKFGTLDLALDTIAKMKSGTPSTAEGEKGTLTAVASGDASSKDK